ncbi:MAG: hypothetical protein J6J71_04575 [Prevotella sp.]|nr:hypothetical protein [Prevotella sp.]
MKIKVALNPKSIKNAINRLNAVKKSLFNMTQEFVMEVAHWLTDRANYYITNSDLGSIVKDKIRSSWSYEPTANGVKIVNNSQKQLTNFGTVPLAVLVEFGVGVVGQSQAHPNATAEGYEYNVDSGHKSADGTWQFWLNSDERDLPMSAFEDFGTYDDHRKGGKRMVVTTRGAKGVWYAYNAIVDAQMELAKANGGEIGKMWEDIKARYIK